MKNKIHLIAMFIFRRIQKSDAELDFTTGDQVFDAINPDGTLNPYLKADISTGGDYITHILLNWENKTPEAFAVLRYRKTRFEEFISELNTCKTIFLDFADFNHNYNTINYQIVYLSRIGIVNHKRKRHLSQVILNFFDFLLFELEKNVFIYSKVRKGMGAFIKNSYQEIAANFDEHWGAYSIISRTLERRPF